jgi:hypothetical protein
MTLGWTQPVTEMSIMHFPRVKGRQVRKDDNLTEPSVSQLCRKCGSLNVSQPFGPLRLVTGMPLALNIKHARYRIRPAALS